MLCGGTAAAARISRFPVPAWPRMGVGLRVLDDFRGILALYGLLYLRGEYLDKKMTLFVAGKAPRPDRVGIIRRRTTACGCYLFADMRADRGISGLFGWFC